MAKKISYTVKYPTGFTVATNGGIKGYKADIEVFLRKYPNEVVKVYRGKKLYAKYGMIDGDIGFTRKGKRE